MREHQFMSYLLANIEGPMQHICGNIVTSNYQAHSSRRNATKQCSSALATTFYRLANAQADLVREWLSLYVQALKLVNTAIRESYGTGSAHEAIRSVTILI